MAPYGRPHPAGSPEERVVKDFAFLAELYVNALLPAWYYRLSAAARIVALLKPGWDGEGVPPARPIAVGGIERRFFCGLLVEMHAEAFADYLGPDQMAIGISHPRPTRHREGAAATGQEGRNPPRDRVAVGTQMRPLEVRPPPAHGLSHRHKAPSSPL